MATIRQERDPWNRAEPLLSANLYFGGNLDSLIQRVVLPFWQEFALPLTEEAPSLWFLRYARGGSHLKIRVHGPEALRFTLSSALQERAHHFFSSLDEPEHAPVKQSRSLALPIDPEDSEEHPDRIFLWTTYQRSSVVFGSVSLLGDDLYVALFTRCLLAGCGITLPAFHQKAGIQNRRQTVLLSLIASGVASVWRTPEERAGYLAYHRNWLVRIPVLRRNLGERKASEIIERYETVAMHSPAVAALSTWFSREDGRSLVRESDDCLEGWVKSLLDLRDHLRRFQERWEYSPDPLADDPLFPVFFKIFHCMANQLGLNPLNEGLAHHLALRALKTEGNDSFPLIPL